MKCKCCHNIIFLDPVSDDSINISTVKYSHAIETGVELTIEDAEKLVAEIQSEIQRIKELKKEDEEE